MALLSFHRDVQADLEAIRSSVPEAHARLVALFEQLKADTRLAEKLLLHGYGRSEREGVSVQKWMDQWNKGLDLWRLKSWDMERNGLKYRVIYLYLTAEARFVVMAIVERNKFDYDDPHDPIRRRINASLRRTYGIGR